MISFACYLLHCLLQVVILKLRFFHFLKFETFTQRNVLSFETKYPLERFNMLLILFIGIFHIFRRCVHTFDQLLFQSMKTNSKIKNKHEMTYWMLMLSKWALFSASLTFRVVSSISCCFCIVDCLSDWIVSSSGIILGVVRFRRTRYVSWRTNRLEIKRGNFDFAQKHFFTHFCSVKESSALFNASSSISSRECAKANDRP